MARKKNEEPDDAIQAAKDQLGKDKEPKQRKRKTEPAQDAAAEQQQPEAEAEPGIPMPIMPMGGGMGFGAMFGGGNRTTETDRYAFPSFGGMPDYKPGITTVGYIASMTIIGVMEGEMASVAMGNAPQGIDALTDKAIDVAESLYQKLKDRGHV